MRKFSNECFRKQLIPIVSSDRSVVGFENIINKIMNAIGKVLLSKRKRYVEMRPHLQIKSFENQ